VPDDCLEALVLLFLGLPELDRAIGTGRDQHVESIDLGVNEFPNHAFMSLGGVKLHSF